MKLVLTYIETDGLSNYEQSKPFKYKSLDAALMKYDEIVASSLELAPYDYVELFNVSMCARDFSEIFSVKIYKLEDWFDAFNKKEKI